VRRSRSCSTWVASVAPPAATEANQVRHCQSRSLLRPTFLFFFPRNLSSALGNLRRARVSERRSHPCRSSRWFKRPAVGQDGDVSAKTACVYFAGRTLSALSPRTHPDSHAWFVTLWRFNCSGRRHHGLRRGQVQRRRRRGAHLPHLLGGTGRATPGKSRMQTDALTLLALLNIH